jgi:hypothetical protein
MSRTLINDYEVCTTDNEGTKVVRYMTRAEHDVLAERLRQHLDESEGGEGWSHEIDDKYLNGQLAMAGAAYTLAEQVGVERAVELWPWQLSGWKPKDKRRNLVRAAALLVAEIERVDRQDMRAAQRQKDLDAAKAKRGSVV